MRHEPRLADRSPLAARARAVRAGREQTLLSASLAAAVSPWFLALTVFLGLNQWLYVAAGACPASYLLGRFSGLHPAPRGDSSP